MSDDDKWAANATGGFNPDTGQLIIQMEAEGASIQLILDNIRDKDAVQRLAQMIGTLPNALAMIVGGLASDIAGKLGIEGFEMPDEIEGIEAIEVKPEPKPTIYRVAE